MKTALNILLFSFFAFSLSFCSLFGGGTSEEETNNPESTEPAQYESSGVYKDIEGESRQISSKDDYSDDDYGDIDTEGDYSDEDGEELILSGTLDEDDVELPVEKIEEEKPVRAKKKVASVAKFKNSMKRFAVNCSMRAKPSSKSKKVGKVRKGKKLWVENHNRNWAKVYKKSGAVYVNKSCL